MKYDEETLDRYSPFLDQEPTLSRPIKRKVVDVDMSEPYELDAAALFELDNGSYAVIVVSGCSCWPTLGDTWVYEARTAEQALTDAIKAAQDVLSGPDRDLVEALRWKVTRYTRGPRGTNTNTWRCGP